jgi:hypothetical protein
MGRAQGKHGVLVVLDGAIPVEQRVGVHDRLQGVTQCVRHCAVVARVLHGVHLVCQVTKEVGVDLKARVTPDNFGDPGREPD